MRPFITDTQSSSDIQKLLCAQYACYIRCTDYTMGQRVIHLYDGPLCAANDYMMIKTHKGSGGITDTLCGESALGNANTLISIIRM